jgi:hypothetical protein
MKLGNSSAEMGRNRLFREPLDAAGTRPFRTPWLACGRSRDLPRILALRDGFPAVARDAALARFASPPIPDPFEWSEFPKGIDREYRGHRDRGVT